MFNYSCISRYYAIICAVFSVFFVTHIAISDSTLTKLDGAFGIKWGDSKSVVMQKLNKIKNINLTKNDNNLVVYCGGEIEGKEIDEFGCGFNNDKFYTIYFYLKVGYNEAKGDATCLDLKKKLEQKYGTYSHRKVDYNQYYCWLTQSSEDDSCSVTLSRGVFWEVNYVKVDYVDLTLSK